MLKYLHLLLPFIFLVGTNPLHAQEIPEQLRQQALQEIQKRGLSEEEVRQRLLARGLDVDNMSVEELQAAQPQIEAVIRELEAEKQADTNSNTTNITDAINPVQQQAINKVTQELGEQKASDIKEKVAEGASVQEAISEELQETSMKRQDEPPSRIYGQELFRNNTLEVYRASKDIKPPDTYVLGVGDVVNISIFGASQDDLQLEIQADGFIRPSNMPRVYLKGITFGQAKTLLQQRFRQAYLFRPEEFALSIIAARTMTINIFGEVETQGSFTISAVNTAFNALVAAGGPTQIGSIRNIRLLRGGKERYLDVYAFMNDPAVQFSF
ncbi:MAG: polysaccharide biosynthesis/export family protein, partial [Saprospiraceae bacterium]|nr:polysaccharide biosynthesis/export family protein [Saprospiraceae bacterium]